jgi:pilus assembly protein Flp/PilA
MRHNHRGTRGRDSRQGVSRWPDLRYAVFVRQAVIWRNRGNLSMLDHLFHRDRGQGLVEYALIIALVAVVVIGILILLGPAIGSIFSQISSAL